MAGSVTILCTGDVHLGRRPTRLPDRVDGHEHATTKVWERIVDLAIQREVDIVALTGDIVDRKNKMYEALGPLQQGLQRLADAGIETYAVSGNHDHDVFTTLVDALDTDSFQLLGRGGEWERRTFEAEDGRTIHLDGWSYPSSHVRKNPLQTYNLEPTDEPVVGLLHTELDNPDAPYAPVHMHDLQTAGPNLWLLGHIHVPGFRHDDGTVPVLYPGSPQPMHPGEPGTHGAWMLEVHEDGSVDGEQHVLSSVRYDPVNVDLEAVSEEADVLDHAVRALQNHVEASLSEFDPVDHLIARPTLQGRTTLHGDLPRIVEGMREDLEITRSGVSISVDKVVHATRPGLDQEDLKDLARSSTPPAVLAELLLDLQAEEPSQETRKLIDQARSRLRGLNTASAYEPLHEHRPDTTEDLEEDAVTLLVDEAWRLLDELRAQQQEDPA